MHVVEAVLAGNVNSRLLRRALAQNIKAVGLSGLDAGLFWSQSIDAQAGSKTGAIVSVDTQLLDELCRLSYMPIISSISCDQAGTSALNINADDAAMALAVAVKAEALIYLSDIAGILKDGQVISSINKAQAEAEIAKGVISGGMIPKVRYSLAALDRGVGKVIIAGFNKKGDLLDLLSGKAGTSLHA